MEVCRICGEKKEARQFTTLPYFTKYKKHSVTWCHACQKLFMEMRKDQIRLKTFLEDDKKFTVSFS